MPTPAPRTTTRAPRAAALAAELRVALVKSVRRLRQERSSEALTDGQYSVLGYLHRTGPRTPRELADHDHVQPPSMTRTVNALEEAGLVARTEHPDDRRQVLVSVTEAGAREVKETLRRRDEWLSRRLSRLTEEERETLARAAEILTRVIARDPEEPRA